MEEEIRAETPLTLNDLLMLSLNDFEFNSGHRSLLENFLRIVLGILEIQPECIRVDTLNDISVFRHTLENSEDLKNCNFDALKGVRFFRSPDDFEDRKSYFSSYTQMVPDIVTQKKVEYLECELNNLKRKMDSFILEFRRRVPCRGDCDDGLNWPETSDGKCRDQSNEKRPCRKSEILKPLPPTIGDTIVSKPQQKPTGSYNESYNPNQRVSDNSTYNKFEMQRAVANASSVLKEIDLCPTTDLPKVCQQICNPVNFVACQLITDKDFLSEIMKRISCPMIEKVLNFEQQMVSLNESFLKFIEKADSELNKRPTAEDCMEEIKNLKMLHKHREDEILHALEEIQEVLDTKFDKYHVPPLKKYITDKMHILSLEISMLKQEKDCPKAVATILKDVQCLSCLSKAVCQMAGVETIPLQGSFKPATPMKYDKLKNNISTHKCASKETKRTCGGQHTVRAPAEKVLHGINLVDSFGQGVVYEPKHRYMQGINGAIYRAEPERKKCKCAEILNKRGRNPCNERVGN